MGVSLIIYKYGYYVWVSYAITFFFLGTLIIYMIWRRNRARRQYINLKNNQNDTY